MMILEVSDGKAEALGELTKIALSLSNHTHVAEVDVRELAV